MTVRQISILFLALGAGVPGARAAAPAGPETEQVRWRGETQATLIVRDDWGIAHIQGRSDSDAVFGMAYAQAEDDFNRVETNFINAMGRLAEVEGEPAVAQDLRMKLFVQPADLQRDYRASPPWLQKLMVAWADGLNCFLRSHPDIRPRLIHHFEPWMALSFSEGSIGGDIEQVDLAALQKFYLGHSPATASAQPFRTARQMGGSNGMAIAPANTLDHHALLLINPHTSFFFRSELQVHSDEGLNAYGAVTWGQFFLYQGFNDRLGWMHTSSGVNNVDFFLETVERHRGRLEYRYGEQWRPVRLTPIEVPFRAADGSMAVRHVTAFYTQHGPIVRQIGDKWVSIALMQRPVEALSQSFELTKARDWTSFMKAMQWQANSSNNTVYADADGNIAYLHPQFVPRRDDRFDYTQPVDGSNPQTDWKGLHRLEELPQLLNPANGWIMNTNDWPYSAAGEYSPKRENFPRYMDMWGENPRGVHATLLLKDRHDFTLDSLTRAAFDSYLPAFAELIPALLADFDALSADDPMRAQMADQIDELRHWDYRWDAHSVATTLAVLWGDELFVRAGLDPGAEKLEVYDGLAHQLPAKERLEALQAVSARLTQDFGRWRIPWDEMNRSQRLNGDIVQRFTDAGPSIPVPFTSARWGSIASFGAQRYAGTRRYYGTKGNSFVAVVEFGPRISARAVSMGGESGDPNSPHFYDQAGRYADGALREVYFYPEQLLHHTEQTYHPR
ncbi:MAG: penicillin acylase family protein [Steroidobacteraceae bacterium]|jgi:acyl-homoserine-lactone acylase